MSAISSLSNHVILELLCTSVESIAFTSTYVYAHGTCHLPPATCLSALLSGHCLV